MKLLLMNIDSIIVVVITAKCRQILKDGDAESHDDEKPIDDDTRKLLRVSVHVLCYSAAFLDYITVLLIVLTFLHK